MLEIKIPIDMITPAKEFAVAANPKMIEDIIKDLPPFYSQILSKRNLLTKGFQLIQTLGEYIIFYGEQENTPMLIFMHQSNSIEDVVSFFQQNKMNYVLGNLEVYEAIKESLKHLNLNIVKLNKVVFDYQ